MYPMLSRLLSLTSVYTSKMVECYKLECCFVIVADVDRALVVSLTFRSVKPRPY